MTTMRKLLDELEAISVKKVAGKNQLNENAHQETVNYITKMKEAFGDMEDDSMAPVVSHDEAPEDDAEQPEEKTVEERLEALEAEVADLKAKLADKE